MENRNVSTEFGIVREELKLFEGPADSSGAPTWTLEDPLSGRFFRLGWTEVEILARWALEDPEQIAADINKSLPLHISVNEVRAFGTFLKRNYLLKSHPLTLLADESEPPKKNQTNPFTWLLKHYLFIRIPLCRPNRFLRRSLPFAQFFFSRFFIFLSLIAVCVGGFLVSRQWQEFTHTFMYFYSVEGIVMAALALFATKILHELGHAYVCTYFGGKVATMGVAFLVLWPVLYTDTSGSWRLKKKKQRLLIGVAGITVELMVAAWALLLWSFLPEGLARSLAFMLATTTWILSLLINLSPFMRFDGYFLLSDLLSIENLQSRSFAYARWWLREKMFAFGQVAPESFSKPMQKTLLIYSFLTWLYRLFLYIGIALAVYHFAFKLLGIFLFIVEIVVFVFKPIVDEIKIWLKMKQDMRVNKNTIVSALFAILSIFLVCFPWQDEVMAPAVIHAKQESHLYAPEGAQLKKQWLKEGQQVSQGDVLFEFSSPELSQKIKALSIRIAQLTQELRVSPFDDEASSGLQLVRQDLIATKQNLELTQRQLSKLTLRAAFDGQIAELSPSLNEGDWLAKGSRLGRLTSLTGQQVEAFVSERDYDRIARGTKAVFIPENVSFPSLELTLMKMENTRISVLSAYPEMASIYGGDIAAISSGHDQFPAVEEALYRVKLEPRPMDQDVNMPNIVMRGNIVIEAEPISIVSRILQQVMFVLIRESSF